ncbi:MAG: hypothetical protein ACRD2D_09600, partial [Terriglobales bacterium]
GRSDWILDNLGPLRQLTPAIAEAAHHLYRPQRAVRSGGRGGFGFGRAEAGPEYPPAGAMIGYTLKQAPSGPLKLEILDSRGQVIGAFSSTDRPPARGRGGFGPPPARLLASAGMHRFYWDLRYPGPWESARQPQGPNGPMAVPGQYQVRLSADGWSETQPLTLIEDPRVTASGVTTTDLLQQFQHNLRARDLVSRVNRLVARLRAAEQDLPAGVDPAGIKALAAQLITPAIRYSKPELQTNITYLYSMTNNSDQKVGQDAYARYQVLTADLARIENQANALLGPAR